MFQRIVVFFLIVSTLSASLTREFVIVGFELNRTYIANTLCINRDKPQLHCNGKCYLMTKLKLAEENEKKQAAKTKFDTFSGFLNGQKIKVSPEAFTFSSIKPSLLYVCFYRSNKCDAIFRPPRVTA